ncbi:MAG: preprotein translocase subunit YajC [Acidobacteriota bacterium]
MVASLLAQQSQSPISLFLPFVLVIGIFYLLIIRPMRKRQQGMEALIASLSNGDKVITNGGIHGTIAGVRDDTFILKVADQVKIEIAKSAIASLQSAPKD